MARAHRGGDARTHWLQATAHVHRDGHLAAQPVGKIRRASIRDHIAQSYRLGDGPRPHLLPQPDGGSGVVESSIGSQDAAQER
jgi:hypothetical protein